MVVRLARLVFAFPRSDAGVVPLHTAVMARIVTWVRSVGSGCRQGHPERMRGWPACSDGTVTVTGGNRLGGGRMQCRQSRDRGSVPFGVEPAVIGG